MQVKRIPMANDELSVAAIGVPNLLNMGFPRAHMDRRGMG